MAERPQNRAGITPLAPGSEELLTLAEAARLLGTSQRTVQRLRERGDLKATKVGRQWRFRSADVAAYVNRTPAAIGAPPAADVDRALELLAGWSSDVTFTVLSASTVTGAPDALLPEPLRGIALRLLQQAIRDGASDIHVEPGLPEMRIRFRVDGALHEMAQLPVSLHLGIIAAFKQMAGLNPDEHRLPQDGSFLATDEGKEYELRTSCLPTLRGETIVMRILDRASVLIDADRLGFLPETLVQIDRLIARPRGLFFVTGPIGAGKSTTLYCLLNRLNSPARKIGTVEDPLNSPARKIGTVEDPIEFELPGVHQVAVNAPLGLTFPAAARVLLRQDADLIMIAEIRDMPTLETAFEASGSALVFSVMHTDDTASAVSRLLDLGIGPFSIASALVGVLAQRLARRLCPACKEPGELSPALRDEACRRAAAGGLTLPADAIFYRAPGCRQCHQTGYHGRIGLFELLEAGPAVKDAIMRRAPAEELRAVAVQNGMRPLAVDGILKALAGLTAVEEVLRVL